MNRIVAKEGWFVSHLFLRVNRAAWEIADAEARRLGREKFESAVRQFGQLQDCQIHCYSIWGLKADLGLLMVCPELHLLNQTEVDLLRSLGAGMLEVVHSFVSMSEISEYVSQETDYDRTLRTKDGLGPDSPEYQKKMGEFRERIRGYIDERLYPRIPAHRALCFYPMNKQRLGEDNWYLLDFEDRKRYMASHGITGRKFQATVRQLVTGSIGLDDWEWGVTLFSDDPYYFKKILYEMRYDEASARFGEFGSFLIGLRLEPNELLERLRM